MMRLLALAVLLPLLLLGSELFPVSSGQMQVNEQRWQRMDPVERGAVRAAWARFQSVGASERPLLQRRMATVARIQERRRRAGREPLSRDELRELLRDVPVRVRDQLGPGPAPPERVRDELRARIQRRIVAFLDNLQTIGRIEDGQRQQLLALPWDERVRRCLDLQRREELQLYEEGRAAPTDPEDDLDTDELESADPLEALEELSEARLRRGFLGRAARRLRLSSDERAELGALSQPEALRRMRRLVVPRARIILEGLDVEPARIEQILRLPYRAQDRVLHRLLLETP